MESASLSRDTWLSMVRVASRNSRPQTIAKMWSRDSTRPTFEKNSKARELRSAELHGLAVYRDALLARIETIRAQLRDRGGVDRIRTTQQRFHARAEFADADRVGDEIVRAGIERAHDVAFATIRRNEHDRHPVADTGAHGFEQVEPGQAARMPVEDQHVHGRA